MKKFLALFLAMMLMLTMAACGEPEEDQQITEKQDNATTAGKQEEDNSEGPQGEQEEQPRELKKNSDGLYEIYTAEDLVLYRQILEEEMQADYDESGHSYDAQSGAIVMADIDMSSVCGEGLGSWRPIGADAVEKRNGELVDGSLKDSLFDGNGHTISGLYISGGDLAGLFATIWETEVRDLTIADSQMCVDVGRAGAIAGDMRDGIISNVCVESDVQIRVVGTETGKYCYVGGIVAYAQEWNYGAVIDHCVSSATVSCGADEKCYVGGIVGYTDEMVDVTWCDNRGAVSGNGMVGGIVGQMNGDSYYNGSVAGCVNYGSVQSEGSAILGGIVAVNGSRVKFCVNVGTMDGGSGASVWGLGINDGYMYDCLNAATLSGDDICITEEKHGITVPAGDPSLTDGTLVARLNAAIVSQNEYWVQGDEFPVWSGPYQTAT